MRDRSLAFAREAGKAVPVLWAAATVATAWVQPDALRGLVARPWAFAFVGIMLGGAGGILWFARQGRDLAAFLSSCAFLLGMVATAMAGLYPSWLRSTVSPAFSLTASNSVSASYGMRVALVWCAVGFTLVLGYFTHLFHSMRGKVAGETGDAY